MERRLFEDLVESNAVRSHTSQGYTLPISLTVDRLQRPAFFFANARYFACNLSAWGASNPVEKPTLRNGVSYADIRIRLYELWRILRGADAQRQRGRRGDLPILRQQPGEEANFHLFSAPLRSRFHQQFSERLRLVLNEVYLRYLKRYPAVCRRNRWGWLPGKTDASPGLI